MVKHVVWMASKINVYDIQFDSLDLPLTAIFNNIFDTGEYPDEWAEGI